MHICGDTFDLRGALSTDGLVFEWHIDDPLWSPGVSVSVALSRTISTEASLSGLKLEDGDGNAIAPSTPFAHHVTGYTASVVNSVSRITIAPTARASSATIRYRDGDGRALTDLDRFTDGRQIALEVGTNTIRVEVTAEDGTTRRTYTVEVTRARQSDADATLHALELSEGVPSPDFSSGVTAYAAEVANGVSDITVSVVKTDSAATVEFVDGDLGALADTDARAHSARVELEVGANMIQVAVTAGDGLTARIYALTVTRAAPSDTDATLRSLTLERLDGRPFTMSPAFDPDTLDYTSAVQVERGAPAPAGLTRVIPKTADAAATIEWSTGNPVSYEPLSGEWFEASMNTSGTARIRVTAGDGLTTKTYTLSAIEPVTVAEPYCALPDTTGRAVIWSASMTPGRRTAISESLVPFNIWGYAESESMGTLSETSFEFRGNQYVIQWIEGNLEGAGGSGELTFVQTFGLDRALPGGTRNGLRLHVCDATYELAGAQSALTSFSWFEPDNLDWSDQPLVFVALSEVNHPPVFEDAGSVVFRTVAERSPPGVNLGAPITATDLNGDTIVYSTHSGRFDIDRDTGQLRTRAGQSYLFGDGGVTDDWFQVVANDGRGGTASIDVQVFRGLAFDGPPQVTSGAGSFLNYDLFVAWEQPSSASENEDLIDDLTYQMRYRPKGTGAWTEVDMFFATSGSFDGSDDPGDEFEVQVRAGHNGRTSNGEEYLVYGPWSESGRGITGGAASGRPRISGAVQVGETLTASTDFVTDPDGASNAEDGVAGYAYTYQWIHVDDATTTSDIAGATARTYTVASSDAGKRIKVRVRFKDDAGNDESVTSLAVDVPHPMSHWGGCIEALDDGADWCTLMSVGAEAGEEVASYGYRGGDAGYGSIVNEFISLRDVSYRIEKLVFEVGAGTRTVTLETSGERVVDDSNIYLGDSGLLDASVDNVCCDGMGYRWTVPADFVWREHDRVAVAVEFGDFPSRGRPAISGTAAVGEELTATVSGITDPNGLTRAKAGERGHAFEYQWVRIEGVTETDIPGATRSTYVLSGADLGKKVRVKVTFEDDGESGVQTRRSRAYPARIAGVAGRALGGRPAITGTPETEQMLTATRGTIDDSDGLPATFPDDYTFQWVRVDGFNETEIPGATSSAYRLTRADEDRSIKVEVGFIDGRGNREVRISVATALVMSPLSSACPASSDWCATLSVGVGHADPDNRGYFPGVGIFFGQLDPVDIEYGGRSWRVEELTYVPSGDEVELEFRVSDPHGSRRALPLGSVLKLDEMELTVDEFAIDIHDDDDPGPGTYSWDLSDFEWAPGQNVAVSLRLGNLAAEGKPVIHGTALEGRLLTALRGTISDPDGLPPAFPSGYTFEWVRMDAVDVKTVVGTASTYTPTVDDVGSTLEVKVGFNDGRGNREVRVSDAMAMGVALSCESNAVWCTRLTVGADTGANALGYCGPGAGATDCGYGGLDEDGFTLGTADYTVESVRLESGNLDLTLDRDFPSADLMSLTLRIGPHGYALNDAVHGNVGAAIANNYRWAGIAPPLGQLLGSTRATTVQLVDHSATLSNDATLSALVVTQGDGAVVTLDPAFAPTTDAYMASVASDAGRVTVTPTETHANATAALTDLDPDTPGYQVDLSPGENVLEVVVTAEDGATTQTYRVTFERRTAPGAPQSLTADPRIRSVILSWEPPADDGGATVTGYEYRYAEGASIPYASAWLDAGDVVEVEVDDLRSARAYIFEVRAVNDEGGGTAVVITATPSAIHASGGDDPVPVVIEATHDHDTIGAGLEDLVFKLTREGATTAELEATVTLVQDQAWLSSPTRTVTFGVGDDEATLTIEDSEFSVDPETSGNLTAVVSGTLITGGVATVKVISTAEAAVTVGLDMVEYTFDEDAPASVYLEAKLHPDYPRAPPSFGVSLSGESKTATFRKDYKSINRIENFYPDNFERVDGQLVARRDIGLELLDDTLYEGAEHFLVKVERSANLAQWAQIEKPDGTAGGRYRINLIDNDPMPMPVLALSADPGSIAEEDDDTTMDVAENVATLTVTVTGATLYGADQTVTLVFTGSATEGTHYTVDPADADADADDYQVVLPAADPGDERQSVSVTLTAQANDTADGHRDIVVDGALGDTAFRRTFITILDDETTTTNTDATGTPAIEGRAHVGEVLTAGLNDIADANVLPATFPDAYTFEWVRVDDMDEATVVGSHPTYTVQTGDVDHTIVVRVRFIDDAGNPEGPLVSAAVGPVVVSGTAADATLSGLALNDGDDNAVALDPAFASDHHTYAAGVAYAVDEVKVIPTKGHENATVAYLDENDAEIADADTSTPDVRDVALDVGVNTIRVEVTSQDGMNELTYALTVTRAQATCSDGAAVPDPTNNAALVADCETLLALRDTLDGSPTDGLNWSGATAMTAWTGVTVSGGRVTELGLDGVNPGISLTGTIPAELGNLTALTSLDLRRNSLTGAIPAELGTLASLTELNLQGNSLTGAIPTELGALASLTELNLQGNSLTGGIPAELGTLEALVALNLSSQPLGGAIPPRWAISRS